MTTSDPVLDLFVTEAKLITNEVRRLRLAIADVARWVPADALLSSHTWDLLEPYRTPTQKADL